MRDVRNEVRKIWEEYKAGELSLNVAGTVNKSAIGLLRFAENEFTAE